MNNIGLELSTSNLVIYHAIQRLVYQYHTMFASTGQSSGYYRELIDVWFDKLFESDNFKWGGGLRVAKYTLDERRLIVTIKQPFYIRDFIIDLEKPLYGCVTIVGEGGKLEDVNVFSIQYKLGNDGVNNEVE